MGITKESGGAVLDTPSAMTQEVVAPMCSQDTPSSIPYGYCHCGCGRKTKLATSTQPAHGRVKGEPSKYIRGHHRRKDVPGPIFRGDHALILLSSEVYVDRFAIVDVEDAERVSQHRWWITERDNGDQHASARMPGERRKTYLHRFILDLSPDDPEVDHIDNNPLNNRRSNLRLTDRTGNNYNRRTRRSKRSPYRGVYQNPDSDKWHARIGKDRKSYHLGTFDTAEDAARAYDEMARQLFGEFAYQNFPVEGER